MGADHASGMPDKKTGRFRAEVWAYPKTQPITNISSLAG